jgi:integrase
MRQNQLAESMGYHRSRLSHHLTRMETLRQGMNPIQLARILRHTSLRMIERTYSHLDQSDAYDAVLKMLAGSATRVG